jgi:hypothetical protein
MGDALEKLKIGNWKIGKLEIGKLLIVTLARPGRSDGDSVAHDVQQELDV